jgi:hypothetical protein
MLFYFLQEKHHNVLQYHLQSGAIKLSKVFELIENHLDDLQIEDYSVSQTTLDNVRFNEGEGGRGRKRRMGSG